MVSSTPRSDRPVRASAQALLVCLTVALALVAPPAAVAAPEEAAATDAGVRRYLAALGSPADPEAVRDALEDLDHQKASAPSLVAALGRAGGAEAAEALAELYAWRDADLRLQVLEAARRVGLRSHRLLERVRSALTARAKTVRLAACETLGHLGDGRDVPLLLDWALADDPQVRHVAFAALRRLSGARLPPVAARWEAWWATQTKRVKDRLLPALRALSRHPSRPDAKAAWADVHRYGWLDLPAVEEAQRAWLGQSDLSLKTEACRFASALGQADLRAHIASVARTARDAGLREAARATLKRLGVPADKDP